MRVFILLGQMDWESETILAVYSSQEKVDTALAQIAKDGGFMEPDGHLRKFDRFDYEIHSVE